MFNEGMMTPDCGKYATVSGDKGQATEISWSCSESRGHGEKRSMTEKTVGKRSRGKKRVRWMKSLRN